MISSKQKEIKLFEAFAGIGSQHKALLNISKKMNWKIKSVGIIEWFIPAICAYVQLHSKVVSLGLREREREKKKLQLVNLSNDSKKPLSYSSKLKVIDQYLDYLIISKNHFKNTFDITKTKYFDIEKNIDIFTYSFPCQDLSNQGKQKGMEKGTNTRSGLLWEIERLLDEMKSNWKNEEMPKYLLLENVSQIGNYKNINSLNSWLKKLDQLNYETRIYCLNSSNFNSAQNRLRAFGLSIRKDWKLKTNFKFPNLELIIQKNKKPLKDILDIEVNNENYLPNLDQYSKEKFKLTKSNIMKSKLIGYTKFSSEAYIYDPNYTGPTLTASGANSRIKILDTKNKIRKLSAKEAFKYMGFNDIDYKKVKKLNLSETQIIYLAGNSIVVQVLEKIFESLRF